MIYLSHPPPILSVQWASHAAQSKTRTKCRMPTHDQVNTRIWWWWLCVTIRFPFRYSVSPLAVLSRHIEFLSHSKATLFHMEVRQRFQKRFYQSRPLRPRYIETFKTGEPRWKYFHTHKKTRNQFLQFRLQKPRCELSLFTRGLKHLSSHESSDLPCVAGLLCSWLWFCCFSLSNVSFWNLLSFMFCLFLFKCFQFVFNGLASGFLMPLPLLVQRCWKTNFFRGQAYMHVIPLKVP